MPSPIALPWLPAVSPRMAIRRTCGDSPSTALWSSNFRPTTFGSMPVPLMSLPIRSISSTSARGNGSRGISRFASTSSSFSRALELFRRDRLDPRRLVVGVLDHGDAGRGYGSGREHFARRAADDPLEAIILDRAVIDGGALVVAQAQSAASSSARSRSRRRTPVCGLTRLQTTT